MEITTNFDPGVILKHLDKIERQAEELRAALPVEFADWQNEDMNRKRAQTKTIDVERPTANFTRASTFILPTSRLRVKRRRRAIRKLKKAGQHERIRTSNRPVLRQELLVSFKQRFVTLLEGSLLMGLDMGLLTKLPAMDVLSRPIDVTPLASQPGVATYRTRGIWHKDENPFVAEDNSIVTDWKASVDVLDAEFAVIPRQGDIIAIPADGTVPAQKTHTVLAANPDGGGMTNLVLEEYVTTVSPAPPPPPVRQRGRL